MADKYVPIFYDWIEATQELNAQEKGRLIDAIVLYARGGEWQEQIKGNERYAFPVFKLQVDRAKDISTIRAASRTNNNKTEQKEQNESKPIKPSNNNNNKNKYKNNNNSDREGARTRFTPPTTEEVLAYACEKGWPAEQFDAVRFVDFYASKGWYVGRNPMKDWRAAARGWVSRGSDHHNVKANPALDYEQRQTGDDYGDDLFVDLDKYDG